MFDEPRPRCLRRSAGGPILDDGKMLGVGCGGIVEGCWPDAYSKARCRRPRERPDVLDRGLEGDFAAGAEDKGGGARVAGRGTGALDAGAGLAVDLVRGGAQDDPGVVDVADAGDGAGILGCAQAEPVPAGAWGGVGGMAVPVLLGLDGADVAVGEADAVDVEAEDRLEIGGVGAVVLDQEDLGRGAARRHQQALVVRHDELRQMVGADELAGGAGVLEHHRVAGAAGQDGLEVALGALGDALQQGLGIGRVGEQVGEQVGHAAQLAGDQEGRDHHGADEQIVAGAPPQFRQRLDHQRHTAAGRRIGLGQASKVARLLERALDHMGVVVARVLEAAAEGLGLDRQAAPGGHGAVVAEHLGGGNLGRGHQARFGVSLVHVPAGMLKHVAGAAEEEVGERRSVGGLAAQRTGHAVTWRPGL